MLQRPPLIDHDRRSRVVGERQWLVLAALACLVGISPRQDGNTLAADSPAREQATATGTISGTVIYQSDPQRPWRYARHYIKWLTHGHLAEAVVALQGKGLTAPAGQRMPVTVVMDQVNYQFVPETLAIQAGDRVQFTNSDVTVHNVRTNDGVLPFNVNTPMGGDYVHTFVAPGGVRKPIRIGCSYHGQMRAWIFVLAHPYFQVTGQDGKFELRDIPPGEFTLEMSHPAGNLRFSQPVAVKAGETTVVELRVSPDQLVEENKP